MIEKELIYVGVKGAVTAIKRDSGRTYWSTHLRGGGFVNLVITDTAIFAHANGHLYCLDPRTGEVKWENQLTGLGYGTAALATVETRVDPDAVIAELIAQQQRQAATATTGAGQA